MYIFCSFSLGGGSVPPDPPTKTAADQFLDTLAPPRPEAAGFGAAAAQGGGGGAGRGRGVAMTRPAWMTQSSGQ